jgi:hypothetical protein
MSVCDWWSKWRYDRAYKRGMDALNRLADGYKEYHRDTVTESDVQYVALFEINSQDYVAKKPDTVESVLAEFVAAGLEMPVVVINGVKRHDGTERYTATIDGDRVLATPSHYDQIVYQVDLGQFDSVSVAESLVIKELKKKLNAAPVETITITYEP